MKNIIFKFLLIFITLTSYETFGQVACSGSGTYSAATIQNYTGTFPGNFGNGTAGYVRVCITAATVGTAMCSGTDEHLRIMETDGTLLGVILPTTVLPVCFTSTVNNGLICIQDYCASGTNSYTFNWNTYTTVGGATSACATCTDGIQNGTETGVDCGGSCPACAGGNCTDGIQNGTETGIDCGGTCTPCVVDCNDGLQNGSETGVDCGGSCPITCTTNTGVTTGTGACTGSELATIYSTNCDQVGTSAYNTNSPTIQAISTTGTAPPGITCGSSGGDLVWARYELDTDVNSLVVAFQSGSIASGSSQTYVAVYNTNSACPVAGDYKGCAEVTSFASGIYSAYNARFDGLDPSKDVWLCFYNTGKSFNLIYDLIGISTPDLPSNVTCGTASATIGEGCNLGALGATFTTPGAAGVACGGGNWGSNENTVYYSFTADATTGSLEVDGISCNEGVTGNAQFGVWTSCAAIGTYGGNFLGCQVGTAPLSLSPLVDGQTYYIAVDGFAGDNCAWNFTGTGIILPIEYAYLSANHDGEKVTVNWSTASELDNDYFTIQRTSDGRSYENIGQIKGAGNSSSRLDYSFDDNDPYDGTSYYRIKQTDFDGKFKYSDIKAVNSKIEKLKLIPNPADAETKINFGLRRAQDVTVKIIDLTGLIVFEKTFFGTKGINELPVDISTFGKGIYNVRLITNGEVTTEKLSVF